MPESMHGSDKPNKMSGGRPSLGSGGPTFQGGIPPMAMMQPGMVGKPPGDWQPLLADISWVKHQFLDVPYATLTKAQCLDLFLPENGTGPFPILVYIHGGGFEMGDKRDAHLMPFLEGINHGLAVASVNYRLSSEAKFPAAVEDVKAAVRWLRANQEKYRLDGKRITACGGSAGGNLASMLGTTGMITEFDNPALGNPSYSSAVQAVVSWFAPIDLLKMDEQFVANNIASGHPSSMESPEIRYLGAPLQQMSDFVRKANPGTFAHPGIPPFFIQHGLEDPLVPYQQSIELAQKLVEASGKERVSLELLEGAGHGDPRFETKENMEKVFTFILAALE